MEYNQYQYIISALLFVCIAIGCNKNEFPEGTKTFGIFKVLDDNLTTEMNGEIGNNTLVEFNTMLERFPKLTKINLIEVPGSSNDEINLQVAKLVYQNDMATHLVDDGLIASGGVDFFLAGLTRTKGSNTQIGVHSWSDGSKEAKDFPVGHANHQPYIDYYKSVGFSQEEAEAFYYFTINAAPAADIHWMTEAEIEQYNILKP